MDQWGRPTFDDGMNIARAFMSVDEMNQTRKERKAKQEGFQVYNQLKNSPGNNDFSKFSQEGIWYGQNMKLQEEKDQIDKQVKQAQLSGEYIKNAITLSANRSSQIDQLAGQYFQARADGNDQLAMSIGAQMGTIGPTNVNVKMNADGTASYTEWGGLDTSKPLTLEEIDKQVQLLKGLTPEQKFKLYNGDIIFRNTTNSAAVKSIVPAKSKDGKTFAVWVGEPMISPDNKFVPPHYARSINDLTPISDEEVQKMGYEPMPEKMAAYFNETGELPDKQRSRILAGTDKQIEDPSEKADTMSSTGKEVRDRSRINKKDEQVTLSEMDKRKMIEKNLDGYFRELEVLQRTEYDPDKLKSEMGKLQDRWHLKDADINSAQPLSPDEEKVKRTKAAQAIAPDETVAAHGRSPMQVAGGAVQPQQASDKTIVKTGVDRKTGRKVVQYNDGTIEYAD